MNTDKSAYTDNTTTGGVPVPAVSEDSGVGTTSNEAHPVCPSCHGFPTIMQVGVQPDAVFKIYHKCERLVFHSAVCKTAKDAWREWECIVEGT